MSVSLTLPWPPSVNHVWRHVGKRVYKSKRYQAWTEEAGKELNVQKPGSVRGHYQAHFHLVPPDARRRDQDNFLKAVNDLLAKHGVIEDDHLARVTTISWGEPRKPGTVAVKLESVPAMKVTR